MLAINETEADSNYIKETYFYTILIITDLEMWWSQSNEVYQKRLHLCYKDL